MLVAVPIQFVGDIITLCIIEITSSIGGAVRGIYTDNPTLLEIISPIVQVFGGTTDTIALEVNNPAGVVAAQSGTLNGNYFNPLASPDISQTQGMIMLSATYLGNSNANGLGVTSLEYPQTFVWGDPSFAVEPVHSICIRGLHFHLRSQFHLPPSKNFLPLQ